MKNYAPINENKDVVTKEYVDPIKSQAAINRTTLGYQCKNLLNWKNANGDESSNVTYTKTNNDITITSNGSWARVVYKLPALEIGTKYTFSAAVSDLSQASATARIRIAYNSEGTNKIVDVNLTKDGEYKAEFTPTESTIYVLFYPNFSSTAYTNSFTASDIMLRYADITDDAYEPYQPSLIDRCLLKDTAGIALGVAQGGSITIDNLSSYTALWLYVVGNVSGINFKTNLVVPVAYLAKSTSNSVELAGGIPSSAYITSEGVLAVKHMNGTITAKVSGNTLNLTIGTGTIGAIEVVSLM